MTAVGSGLTLPFLIVYLRQVREFPLSTASLVLATVAAASLVGNPSAGVLCDRIGSRLTVVVGLVAAAGGSILLAGVHAPWQAFAAAATLGLGVSTIWPAQDALLAELVAPEQRSSVFSVRHLATNAGLGAGALLAAVVVDADHPSTFSALYVLDGLSFAAFVPLVLAVVPRRQPRVASADSPVASGGHLQVLADPRMVGVIVLSAVVVTLSYGQFHSAFPAWATRPGGIAPRAPSLAFAATRSPWWPSSSRSCGSSVATGAPAALRWRAPGSLPPGLSPWPPAASEAGSPLRSDWPGPWWPSG